MKNLICNISEAPRNSKQRNLTFYLDAIKKLPIDGHEFATFEAQCTDGDIRPPYPYQWIAKSTMIPGDDDPFEGIGATPLEALRDLHKEMRYAAEHPEEFNEETL
jgi:hypothetical protein